MVMAVSRKVGPGVLHTATHDSRVPPIHIEPDPAGHESEQKY